MYISPQRGVYGRPKKVADSPFASFESQEGGPLGGGGVQTSWKRVEEVAGKAVILLKPKGAMGCAFNGLDGDPGRAEKICGAMGEYFLH